MTTATTTKLKNYDVYAEVRGNHFTSKPSDNHPWSYKVRASSERHAYNLAAGEEAADSSSRRSVGVLSLYDGEAKREVKLKRRRCGWVYFND